MDKALQKIQQQVTTSGSSFSEAQIFSEQKVGVSQTGGIRSEWALELERLLSSVIRYIRSSVKALRVVHGTYPLMSRSLRERIKSRLRLV